jgi:hypothetical protein
MQQSRAEAFLSRLAADEAVLTDRQRAAQNQRSKEDIKNSLRREPSASGSAHPKITVKEQPKVSASDQAAAKWQGKDFRKEARFSLTKYTKTWLPSQEDNGDGPEADEETVYQDRPFRSLWDLADEMRDSGVADLSSSEPDPHTFYYGEPSVRDYRTGEEEKDSFFVSGISAPEAKQLWKLVKMKRDDFAKAEPEDQG